MKKIILYFLALALLQQSFAQTTAFSQREIFWQKSKHQRTAAWVLLGGGATLFVIGATIGFNSFENDVQNGLGNLFSPSVTQANHQPKANGSGLAAVGAVCAAGSIPFFIMAGNNRRLAIRATSFQHPGINTNQWTFRSLSGIELKFTQTLF